MCRRLYQPESGCQNLIFEIGIQMNAIDLIPTCFRNSLQKQTEATMKIRYRSGGVLIMPANSACQQPRKGCVGHIVGITGITEAIVSCGNDIAVAGKIRCMANRKELRLNAVGIRRAHTGCVVICLRRDTHAAHQLVDIGLRMDQQRLNAQHIVAVIQQYSEASNMIGVDVGQKYGHSFHAPERIGLNQTFKDGGTTLQNIQAGSFPKISGGGAQLRIIAGSAAKKVHLAHIT